MDELLKLVDANVVEPELFEVLGDDSDELENKMPGLKRLNMKRETKVRYDWLIQIINSFILISIIVISFNQSWACLI